jgi:hypothetical protein
MKRSCCYIGGREEVREDFFIDQTVEKMSGDFQTLENILSCIEKLQLMEAVSTSEISITSKRLNGITTQERVTFTLTTART